ncbi:hypothetical protein ABLB84_03715 [Xenorhabdus szentirmaii]|uniref:hypothetical protein n=1 Tax=Xenorhabdus szentirmaii TaxID=290112 RepID=UPI0032B81DE3
METSFSQWLFSAGQPYCLLITMASSSEPVPVQLYWRAVRKKECRLYLSIGRECRILSDGDFTVFRLTETQWQTLVEGKVRIQSEPWESLPFTLSELALHPEFATLTALGMLETDLCEQ